MCGKANGESSVEPLRPILRNVKVPLLRLDNNSAAAVSLDVRGVSRAGASGVEMAWPDAGLRGALAGSVSAHVAAVGAERATPARIEKLALTTWVGVAALQTTVKSRAW